MEPRYLPALTGTDNLYDAGKAVMAALSTGDEIDRRAHGTKLRAFVEGRGDYYLYELLHGLFADSKNRALRTSFLELARGNSVIGRVLDETATIYSQPAKRLVQTGDDVYQRVLDEAGADAVMAELDRLLVAFEDVLLVPRVIDDMVQIDLVPPDAFAAIAMPGDPTVLALIAVACPPPTKPDPDAPSWRLYSRDATYVVNSRGEIVAPVEANELGEWSVILVSSKPASARGRLLDARPSADLLSAEQAVMFLACTSVKEAKSATNQVYVTGDVSATVMGQSGDTESEVFLGEGVSVTNVQRGVSLAQYSDLATKLVDDTLANHGIAPSLRRLADAGSGAAEWARRQPLLERRRRRLPLLRKTERRLWGLVAKILGSLELPTYAMDGWSIDFVEPVETMSESEALAIFETKRRLFLDDTLSELRRRNPDLSVEQATEELRVIVERETSRVALTQDLQAMNGGAASTVGSPTAIENGRTGAATSQPRELLQ